MKKVTLITLDKEAESTVQALRQLGVLHVQHEQLPKGEDITSLQEKLSLAEAAIAVLSVKEFSLEVAMGKTKPLTDWSFTAQHIIDLRKRIEQLEEFAATLSSRINQQENWGDFSPEAIEELSQKNIFVRLYQLPLKEMQLIPKDVVVKKLFTAGGIINYAIISYGKVEVPFKEVPLPKMGLEKLRKRLTQDKQAAQSLKEEIRQLVCYRPEFLKIKKSLESELEFHQAIRGMGQSGALTYISGYMPFDKVESVVQMAKKEKWGLVVRDPSEEDDVPVLIRNPRWISLVSPIFKFLEILPGYRERDISLPFLIFFSIFFGILIGDAGYGIIYALITFLRQKKAQKKGLATSSFFLFYILSLCAIIWGAFTGTFFGQEWFLRAGYKPLLPVLNDERGIQRFCFFLGALHLSLAHGWRAMLKAPSPSALGDLGWLCILWSAFFIAKTLILGDAFPAFSLWLFISGATLVILFTNPQKNILKSAEEWISWLVTLPFSLISNFADVVSYIRLFAVGLAGVAIADAFNAMAAMVGKGNMLMLALSAFVALIGNALGVVLGPVSVLVHGVRLNLLEFSGHMGLSWSGSPYKPLKA